MTYYFTSLQLNVLPLEDHLGMVSGKVHVKTDYSVWLLDYVFVSVANFYLVVIMTILQIKQYVLDCLPDLSDSSMYVKW